MLVRITTVCPIKKDRTTACTKTRVPDLAGKKSIIKDGNRKEVTVSGNLFSIFFIIT
jgi:hypothetical protein